MTQTIPFVINDNTLPPARRRRDVELSATPEQVEQLVDQGYLQLGGIFDTAGLDALSEALERIAAAESGDPRTEHLAGNGHYIRDLLNKEVAFHALLAMKQPLAISRAVLGPQLWFDAEARIVPAGVPGLRVNWHIHHRVIPDPLPPLFCYPHAIHGLLYLDDVDESSGPICLLPGSHRQPQFDLASDSQVDQPGQLILPVRRGTCLLAHANLWHRTLPTTERAKRRRVILFGYTPAWIKGDVSRGVKADTQLTDRLRANGDDEIRELLGGFVW